MTLIHKPSPVLTRDEMAAMAAAGKAHKFAGDYGDCFMTAAGMYCLSPRGDCYEFIF